MGEVRSQKLEAGAFCLIPLPAFTALPLCICSMVFYACKAASRIIGGMTGYNPVKTGEHAIRNRCNF
jgi:hypothetical protein